MTAPQRPIETSWLFLTVVLEKMLEYRYVYDNPRGVMTRFDDVDRGVRRLLRMKQKVCNNIAEALIPASDSGAHQHLSTLTNTHDAVYELLAELRPPTKSSGCRKFIGTPWRTTNIVSLRALLGR